MTKNAIVGSGRAVHGMRPAAEGQLSYEHIKCGAGWTNAGGRMVASKIYLTDHAVTCKRCRKIEAAEAAPAPAVAEEGASATVELTPAQDASLKLVAAGSVSYSPGRTYGTRYSYSALVGGKSARRTKSVDALVELGLADLAGSANENCPVVLTEAGRARMGVEATPVTAILVRFGRRIVTANGTHARVVDVDRSHAGVALTGGGTVTFRLKLAGGLCFNETVGALSAVKVLS